MMKIEISTRIDDARNDKLNHNLRVREPAKDRRDLCEISLSLKGSNKR